METLRASHVFLCVDVFIDEKRFGGHGTEMRFHAESTFKDVLALFLSSHAPDYSSILEEPSSFSHVRYRDDDVVVVAFVVVVADHVVVVAFVVVVVAHVVHAHVFAAAGTS